MISSINGGRPNCLDMINHIYLRFLCNVSFKNLHKVYPTHFDILKVELFAIWKWKVTLEVYDVMGGEVCFCFASFVTLDICFTSVMPVLWCTLITLFAGIHCIALHCNAYIWPAAKRLHDSESESTDYIVCSHFKLAKGKGVDTRSGHEEIQGQVKLLKQLLHTDCGSLKNAKRGV